MPVDVVGPVPSARLILWLADREKFDAALLNVRLPDDGVIEVVGILTERKVPFVVVTGHEQWTLPEALRGAPYVDKPVDYSTLVEMISVRLAGLRV